MEKSVFHLFSTALFVVSEVPRYPPNIQGLQPRYRLGDWLRANCSTDFSHPPANLTIYVNGQQVRIDNSGRYANFFQGLQSCHKVLALCTFIFSIV